MANDHYTPKFLTSPWEFGQRSLRYFDFCTRSFHDAPARNLFAKRDLNPPALERWVNHQLETPMGAFTNRLRQGVAVQAPRDNKTLRALALLFILGPQRIAEGVSPERERVSLEVVSGWDETALEASARWVSEKFNFSIVSVPMDLFFTEAVTFVYPMPEKPVVAMPLGLRHALLAYSGPLTGADLLENVSRQTLSALSLGVGSNVHRVILSPTWRAISVRDPDGTRAELLSLRADAVDMVNLVGKYSVTVGLTGWRVT